MVCSSRSERTLLRISSCAARLVNDQEPAPCRLYFSREDRYRRSGSGNMRWRMCLLIATSASGTPLQRNATALTTHHRHRSTTQNTAAFDQPQTVQRSNLNYQPSPISKVLCTSSCYQQHFDFRSGLAMNGPALARIRTDCFGDW